MKEAERRLEGQRKCDSHHGSSSREEDCALSQCHPQSKSTGVTRRPEGAGGRSAEQQPTKSSDGDYPAKQSADIDEVAPLRNAQQRFTVIEHAIVSTAKQVGNERVGEQVRRGRIAPEHGGSTAQIEKKVHDRWEEEDKYSSGK